MLTVEPAACCVSTKNGHSTSAVHEPLLVLLAPVLDHDRKTAEVLAAVGTEKGHTQLATPTNEVVCDAMKQQSVSSPTDGA